MGNKHQKIQSDFDRLNERNKAVKKEIYIYLTRLGFNESTCAKAVDAWPNDKQKATDFASSLEPEITLTSQTNKDEKKYNEKKYNDKPTEHDSCTDILKCRALEQLIGMLKSYQFHSTQTDNNQIETEKYINKHIETILNDYHHVLQYHLNEDHLSSDIHDQNFKYIYDKIMNKINIKCDIKSCGIYNRNSREREKIHISESNKNMSVFVDIIDTIHCYFLHSVDIGYRVIETFNDNSNNDENSICYDPQLLAMKQFLHSKRKDLEQIRGIGRVQNNKFVTEHKNMPSSSVEQKQPENDENNGDSEYSFGMRFNYWDNEYYNDHYDFERRKCAPIYSNLCEEIISNKIYTLNKDIFDAAMKKADCLIRISDQIKCLKCVDSSYGIQIGSKLDVQHILSVVLYTDYDILSHHFSTTFRDFNQWHKNMEFGHWTKALVETVNSFGISMEASKINSLYHGISFMYFDKFLGQFDSPTSTTTKLAVATIFAKTNGLILELQKDPQDWIISNKLRYFDCSFISCFANESERLFIQPTKANWYYLAFISIRNMSTNETYKYFIEARKGFEKIIINVLHKKYYELSKQSLAIMNDLINQNKEKYPDYVAKSFTKWTNKYKKISLNANAIRDKLADWDVWTAKRVDVLRVDKFVQLFKNAEIIKYTHDNKRPIILSLLSVLTKIKNKGSKLRKIMLTGCTYHYKDTDKVTIQRIYKSCGWILHFVDILDGVLKKDRDRYDAEISMWRTGLSEYQIADVWYHLFSKETTFCKDATYSWKIAISNETAHFTGDVFIGIIDKSKEDKYYDSLTPFIESKCAIGIDGAGNLYHGNESRGKFCSKLNSGDIVDVRFDNENWKLKFVVNGNDVNTTYDVPHDVDTTYEYSCCIAMFGFQDIGFIEYVYKLVR